MVLSLTISVEFAVIINVINFQVGPICFPATDTFTAQFFLTKLALLDVVLSLVHWIIS